MYNIIIKKKFDLQKKEIIKNINKNTNLILVKEFCSKKICKNIVQNIQLFSKKIEPFSKTNKNYNYYLKKKNFWEYRVLPFTSKTSHLYRIFHINIYHKLFPNDSISNFIKKYVSLQTEISGDSLLNKNIKINPKIIQYPRGGGFFDWHIHKRYPQNYGLILNLSKKNNDYESGTTKFRIKKKIISFEKIMDQGDLIVFKYNIPHAVSKVDKDHDLTFDNKGRWTFVMPIY